MATPNTLTLRRLTAATMLAVALPALSYVLPVPAILRRVAERRAALELSSLEVTGTLQAEGPAAERLARAVGADARGGVALPARFLMKVPGRCRLELVQPDVAESARPFVAIRDARTRSSGLEDVPAAAALLRGVCALLAVSTAGEPAGAAQAYAAALGRRGVAVSDASLGRFDGRLAYVIGGRGKEARPAAFVDKEVFQPLRLVSTEGGLLRDVRLLGWGSPTGGDWFPRAVEVWEGETLILRLTTERAAANLKLADTLFP